MDGHQSSGPRGQGAFNTGNVHHEEIRIAVDENGTGTGRGHCESAGNKRIDRHDDLVARSDSKREKSELQGSRSVAHAHAIGNIVERGKLLLKFAGIFAKNEIPAADGPLDGSGDFGFDRVMLPM